MSDIPWAYPLFEHMSREHGLKLIDSELDEIIRVVRSLTPPKRFKVVYADPRKLSIGSPLSMEVEAVNANDACQKVREAIGDMERAIEVVYLL